MPGPWLRMGFISLSLTGSLAAENRSEAPKVWLNHYKLGGLATAADSDWAVTRGGIDTAFFAINTLWPMDQPMKLSIPPQVAAATAEKLHKNGIKIGVECGYFDHAAILKSPQNPASNVVGSREIPSLAVGVGERIARIEIAKLRSLWQAGHPPDYLILDDPMRRLTVPGQDNVGQILQGMPDYPAAALEVSAYMKVMKEKFPAVKFVVILNFPNWGWKGEPAFSMAPGRFGSMNWGDAHAAMEALFSAVKKSGQSIQAIQGDFPWRYFAEQPPDAIAATVDWPGRILQLEQYAHTKGVDFHLTTNSETGYVSAKAFSEDSLKYLDAYLAVGGKPDRFVVQSWYPHPEELLPESQAYTGTWLTARFIERLREIQIGSPVAADARKTRPFDRSEPEALLHLLKRLNPPVWDKLAPAVLENWLDNKEDPPASVASLQLRTLREAVASAIAGKPKATIVIRDDGAQAAAGMPRLELVRGASQTWIVEIVCASSKSELATIWIEHSTEEPMTPVWMSPGGSRLMMVNVNPARAKNGTVTLCVGKPGEKFRKVSIPVNH